MRLARKQAIALARIWEWKTHIAMLLAGLVGISIGVWFDRVVLLHREGQPSGLLTFASITNCEPPPPPPPPCECPKADLSAALPPTPLRAEDSPLVSSCDGALSLEDVFRHDASLRPQPRVPDAASVCMVVRTFEGHRNKLMVLLSTVLLWDHPALTIYLLDTGKGDAFTALPDVANMTSRIAGRPGAVRVSHWRNAESRAAFPQLGDIEDHGYIATDLTIDDILAMRQAARDAGTPPAELPCDTLIITNGDNLYGFEYLSATQEAMRAGAVMVNTHWVAHYDMKKEWILGWGEIQNGHCGPWRPGRDGEVAASPKFIRGCVDLGVVSFKASLLEEYGYRFVVDRLRLTKTHEEVKNMLKDMQELFYADGNFYSKIYSKLQEQKREDKAVMIRRALFVHQ